jgi:ComF family protein
MLGPMLGLHQIGLDRIVSGLRLLAAPQCAVCRVECGDPVCTGCLTDFFDASVARCHACAGRLPATSLALHAALRCGRCLAAPPAFDQSIALGDYAPPLDGMVMALKSGGRLDLARVFGHLLAARAQDRLHLECIVAVPLAWARKRERGFNQSQEIARVVARRLSLPLRRHALVRLRAGPPQQSLPLQARRRNVRGVFALRGPLDAGSVGVVDDVLTTGATLDEVARVLKRGGAAQVVNLVIARTP